MSSQASEGSAPAVNPYGFDLSKGVYSLDQVMDAYRLMGPDLTSRVISVSEGYLSLLKSCVPLQYGTVRSASSSGSSNRSSGSDKGRVPSSSGVAGSRLDAISRVNSWRRVTAVPDGYCYSKMLKDSAAEAVVSRLGELPTVGKLARLRAESFQSLGELERFRLLPVGADIAHVAAGGAEGEKVLDVLGSYSGGVKLPPGSLGAVLSASGRPFVSSSLFSGKTRVGGLTKGSGGGSSGTSVSSSSSGFAVGEPSAPSASVAVGSGSSSLGLNIHLCPAVLFVVVRSLNSSSLDVSRVVGWAKSVAGGGVSATEVVFGDREVSIGFGLSTTKVARLLREVFVTLHGEVGSVVGVGNSVVSVNLAETLPVRYGNDVTGPHWFARYSFAFSSGAERDAAVGGPFLVLGESGDTQSHVDLLLTSEGSLSGSLVVRGATLDDVNTLSRFVAYALKGADWAVSAGYVG